MAREPEELVEMRRVLGAQLATFRQAAELSQGQLARVALVDRTTVAHIEKGRARADERFWTVVDAKCGADGVLLAGFRAWEAAKQEHEVRIREAQLAQVRAQAQELRATLASQLSPQPLAAPDRPATPGGQANALRSAGPSEPDFTAQWPGPLACSSWVGSLAEDLPATVPDELDEVIGQLARLLGGWIRGMNRRTLFQLLTWGAGIAAAPAVLGLNTDEQERLARALGSPSRIDQGVIGHLESMFRHCQFQEDALGSRAILPIALGQLNLVDDLLVQCPESFRPNLLSIYSNMCTSIAYYFFELNDIDKARYYHEQARSVADSAGNIELSIYALGEWSYTESWYRNIPAGIDLAGAAQILLDKTGDPLMRVAATQRAASAYAASGQVKACMAELDKAQISLGESAKQAPPESSAYFFNVGYLASHRSECLLRLGKSEEAASSARAGLRVYDKSFMDGYAVCALHLGNAALQAGEIEEAARVVGDAAGVAIHTRSARLMKELRTTRATMQSWKDNTAVKTLEDQLSSWLSGPGGVGRGRVAD